jgi:SAM-dependent methyltransferase
MIDFARCRYDGVSGLTFRTSDIIDEELPIGRYDYISCIASIHHVPFEPVVARLRAALAPDGVLAILGLYRVETLTDELIALVATPINWLIAMVLSMTHRVYGRLGGIEQRPVPRHPVRPATMSLAEIRAAARRQLPGATMRRHVFWRYSLVYRNH